MTEINAKTEQQKLNHRAKLEKLADMLSMAVERDMAGDMPMRNQMVRNILDTDGLTIAYLRRRLRDAGLPTR